MTRQTIGGTVLDSCSVKELSMCSGTKSMALANHSQAKAKRACLCLEQMRALHLPVTALVLAPSHAKILVTLIWPAAY